MEMEEALKIQAGTLLQHARLGSAIAMGSAWKEGERVWIYVPEDPISPDIPYNAHISQLEFRSNEN